MRDRGRFRLLKSPSLRLAAPLGLVLCTAVACVGISGDPDGPPTGISIDDEFPSVAIPCPAGFSASQCAIMYDAIANLRAHGMLECQWAGAEFERQLNEGKVDWGNNADPGEGLTTGQSWRFQNGTWDDRTTIFDHAFLWEGQLEGVIAHEIYGHQTLGDISQGHVTAVFYEAVCGGTA